MHGTKLRSSGITSTISGDETIRRVTREKIVIRGNKTIRTLDSTTSFLPVIERYDLNTFSHIRTGKKSISALIEKIYLIGAHLCLFILLA